MHPATVFISALALALSMFTFYWTTLRNKKAFYLMRIGDLTTVYGPQFALVNGGKRDLLITSLLCVFEHKDKNGGFYPAQRISFYENDGMLLPAGKAVHCKVEFVEPFTSTFAVSGTKEPNTGDFYLHQMNVEIEWVEMNGKLYKKTVPHSRFGFDEVGKLRTCAPSGSKHDLYAK